MALTIDDIYDKEFIIKGQGYDRNDVDQFLDQICDEMISMQEHADQLKMQVESLERELTAAREMAETRQPEVQQKNISQTSNALEGILLSAQRLADEQVENARKQADDIIAQAQEKADHMVETAHQEHSQLDKELDMMRDMVSNYKKSFLELLSKQKELLDQETFAGE